MPIYEIANPSDRYTIDAPEGKFPAACIATCVLGGGAYGLTDSAGKLVMPLFIFGGIDPWFRDHCGADFPTTLALTPPDDVIAALDSILIGSCEDRDIFNDAIALMTERSAQESFRASWCERKRGSLNDIGGRARQLADVMRRRLAV